MFAAVLVVCSLYAVNCEIVGGLAIYGTEQDCREGAAQFVVAHERQLTKSYGPHVANLWCRPIPGLPS